jgi:hypothetical protein
MCRRDVSIKKEFEYEKDFIDHGVGLVGEWLRG